jgi:hypothetical protein
VYADLIASAATSPQGIHKQREALQAMADRLNLDRIARRAVHAALATAWKAYPTFVQSLTSPGDL